MDFCNWNSLILSSGLKAYSFTFNSISVCLTTLFNYYLIPSGLNGGEYYEISVQQSSTLNCLNNEYSGINSTTSITTLSPYQPTQTTDNSNNSNTTTAITVGILVPIIAILIIIIGILLYKKTTRKTI
ncbi:paired immunoglobulin-like type 2 receptor [Anaeramoeba ignava]|uniref:Paired immunoglobulin-like type 2 receptor n=1 Tax=Anaeramoeba ignava TaxID=1746090 RepID=A0A9Q0L7P2_ANAIG|nr:paired immunoglobulin-like type 2 receptor [Anaeramoeba ignava]